MGLLCPNCRTMCQGVQALKEHMQICKGGTGNSAPPRPGPAAMASGMREPEEPQNCDICDKSFKSHRTLDNHMKKQHGLAAPPKPVTAGRGRGRPKKALDTRTTGWGSEGYSGEAGSFSEPGPVPAAPRGRPVGQVAPQRNTEGGLGGRPGPSAQPSTSTGETFRSGPQQRGRGRGGPAGMRPGPRPAEGKKPGPGEAAAGPGGVKPDLQQLGRKFGGQISITSTGNTGGRAGGLGGPDSQQGVSVTKLKGDVPVGDPVSIKDATNTKAGKAAPPSPAGESSKSDGQPDSQNVVKEEPKDEDVGGGNDDFGDYGDGDYGDGNEGEYIGPGGDGMYAEADYAGDGEDQEGMDIEYFSQYKDREDFDGGFEGEYGEEDPVPEEEYEEEA